MTQARGFYEQAPIIPETTYGETPTVNDGDMILAPFVTIDIGSNENMIESQVILPGNRSETEPALGHVSVEGSIEVPVDVRYFGYWLKLFYGAPTTTPDGDNYVHVFSHGNNVPSFTLDDGYPDINQYKKFNGLKLDSMSMNIELNNEVTCSFQVFGREEILGSTPLDSSPNSSLVLDKFHAQDFEVGIDGSAYDNCTDVSIEQGNHLNSGIYTAGSNGFRHSLPATGFSCNGVFHTLFEDRNLYTDALNGTSKRLTPKITRGDFYIEFDMPEIMFPRSPLQKNGKDVVYEEFKYRAFYKKSTAKTPITVTLKNDVASYA